MSAAAALVALGGGAAVWGWGVRVPGASRRPVLGGAAIGVLTAVLGLAIAAAASGGEVRVPWGGGLGLSLHAGGVAGPVAVLVAAVALPVVAYAAAQEDVAALPRLLGLLVSFVGAMELLVLAGDLLTLTFAWELVAALSWALIGSAWARAEDVRLAGHAFLTTRAGSLGLIAAAGAALAGSGSLAYASLADVPRPLLDVVAAGVVLAAASKSAQLPFSPWLFSAMAGPTPVSALLHSATMVAAGAYALIRLGAPLAAVPWFGPVLVVIGGASAIAGGVVALAQHHGKRILAASTVAQYGLMFLAVGVGAFAAATAHLVTHAVFKALLFLSVGVGLHVAGAADVRRWRLGREMPRVALAAGVGALALAAVPPLGAAWSKEQIVTAALHAGPGVGTVALVAGLLSAAYAARLQVLAFGRDGAAGTGDRPRVPRAETAAVTVLAAASLALGVLWWEPAARRLERLVGASLVSAPPWELVVSLALVAAGLALGWWLPRAGRELLPPRLRDAAAEWFGLGTAARLLVVEPVLALAVAAGRFDDVVVDGAVRRVARAGRLASRGLSWGVERGVDGVVKALAAATAAVAERSRLGDDRRIDGTVEALARGVGAAGTRARRLQSGLAHRYYVIAVVGLLAVLATAAVWR